MMNHHLPLVKGDEMARSTMSNGGGHRPSLVVVCVVFWIQTSWPNFLTLDANLSDLLIGPTFGQSRPIVTKNEPAIGFPHTRSKAPNQQPAFICLDFVRSGQAAWKKISMM
jgi:hypothetical protein